MKKVCEPHYLKNGSYINSYGEDYAAAKARWRRTATEHRHYGSYRRKVSEGCVNAALFFDTFISFTELVKRTIK